MCGGFNPARPAVVAAVSAYMGSGFFDVCANPFISFNLFSGDPVLGSGVLRISFSVVSAAKAGRGIYQHRSICGVLGHCMFDPPPDGVRRVQTVPVLSSGNPLFTVCHIFLLFRCKGVCAAAGQEQATVSEKSHYQTGSDPNLYRSIRPFFKGNLLLRCWLRIRVFVRSLESFPTHVGQQQLFRFRVHSLAAHALRVLARTT